MGSREAILLEGMLFGFQGDISDDDMLTFQKTGLIHIFSVSGFHVGFILALGFLLANGLRLKKRTRFLFVSALIVAYGFLTAWPGPLIRAAVMAWMGLAAYYLGREADLPTALAAAGLLLLLINPANLFEISWQLSFLATWGIIFLYPRLKAAMTVKGKVQAALIASLAPQAAVLPLAAYYFNMVSLISMFANLLLVDLAGAAVALGFIGIVIAQASQILAAAFMVPAGLITQAVVLGAEGLEKIPMGYLWVAQPGVMILVLVYAGILLLCWRPAGGQAESGAENGTHDQEGQLSLNPGKHFNWIRLAGALLIAIYLFSILLPGQWRDPGRMKIVFIDVGQGDCIFIKTAGGKTVLVDGGGSDFYDVGAKVVLPYLRRQGIRYLDLAIVTHPHTDHLAGWETVLAQCPARVAIAGTGYSDAFLRQIPNLIVVRGYHTMVLDDFTTLQIWNPDLDLTPAQAESEAGNDASVVTHIAMKNISVLLTGDAAQQELKQMEERREIDWASTIWKVPHHGSKYSWSESFLRRVRPAYAAVSVGENNSYGHPDPNVITGMQKMGIKVFRTDRDGAVTFTTDGYDVRVETVKSKN
jgi:competence protein ComEC